ncbi:SDR family NAD(P)-dependent oxidoreductase [Paenibacillus monticola]|uniref:SDR family NAD(P)-dependent oxidoreductase n=1 Tax=Paenibacillus monticola TaxID=2666075 RepID=A0A7X2HA55_9BACL|nr:SDR family NAD(P)-dependent oxidoreductase [Paenibacillus monticola]MRN56367.1 SDR family NAD(P)-dependent oxidoreductase [Paenibacillus monticola]
MEKRTVIITGGNSGLGYQCAKNIAKSDPGYHIILACRNAKKADMAAETLKVETNNLNISTMDLDLASLSSIRMFYQAFSRADLPPLYAVVCNAGIGAGGVPGQVYTKDGIEMIFGVNHLGHFLLTNLLLNRMGKNGRIVFVSSDMHEPPAFLRIKVRYENARAISAAKPGILQYGTSKLCNLYCSYEMARLIETKTDRKITVNAFNPGAMSDTNFVRVEGSALLQGILRVFSRIMNHIVGKPSTSIKSGAALASLVTEASFDTMSGKYVDRGEITKSSTLSYSKDNARELWKTSMELSQLRISETIFENEN